MIGYADKEMISSTELQKSLSLILNKLKNHSLEKVAVLRNNKIETVIISRERYEKIQEDLEFLEHIEIYNTVSKRKTTPKSDYISFDEVLKQAGMDKDELQG